MTPSHSTSKPRIAVIVGARSKHDKYGDSAGLSAHIRWGLGGALSLRFAQDYTVVLMGRSAEELAPVVEEVARQGGHAVPIACDVTDDLSVDQAFAQASALGRIEVMVFNVAPPFPPGVTVANLPLPHEIDPAYLQRGFDIGVTGALRCVRAVIGPMLDAGRGTILLSGATAALRGGASFAAMSPIKFGLRSLGQSLFQAYAPRGVHVAHVVIDGPIDSPGLRALFKGQEVAFLDPGELAEAYVMLANQPASCWSHELQLTPNLASIGTRL
ncbi:MAG: SDR family NAD(P)-dependent oxidoreductase [Sterolibacteriaceae bacterium]|nr:SDR family NAD(P)-dependent oxidoreductase [Sterolibacteriaceae bacterium]MBK9085663.1 SDR family NAD(P)-dependent oxidoreductase [Sterolibacteriaceae bacterium]